MRHSYHDINSRFDLAEYAASHIAVVQRCLEPDFIAPGTCDIYLPYQFALRFCWRGGANALETSSISLAPCIVTTNLDI